MDTPASPVDSGSTATRPSGDSRKSSWDEMQAALFYATNAARFNNNRKVLRYDRGCALAAQTHAADMAVEGFFDHQNPYDWLASPGHKKNMLMSTLTHLGTGAFDAGSKWADLNLKCVQVFANLQQ